MDLLQQSDWNQAVRIGIAIGITCLCSAIALPAQEPVDFAHDILPVLNARCAKCHTNGEYKGGLSLESRAQLMESGAIELGSHQGSDLFARITSSDPDEQMPPEGERLTDAQVKKFQQWIDTGLEWPEELSLKRTTFKRPLELNEVVLPESQNGVTHPIDRLLEAYFEQNKVEHPPQLEDWQYLRRVKLDLLGQLPTPTEIERFVADSDNDKHEKIVVEFLSRERDYADHWISFWNDLLRNDYAGTGFIDGGRQQITEWLHRSLSENKPYDQFVRELVSPTPDSEGFIQGIKWRGRVNASQIEPLQFSQNVSQVFLGINLKCASCHDSFIDDWKLADAYGLAAIIADDPLELHRCDVPTGEIATSKFVFPGFEEIDHSLSRKQRLEKLASIITSKPNGRLPRTIVNRLWHRLAGRGLVHPVDMMANEAWSEALLDYLALDLVAHGYDLKRTLQLIATSRVYQSQSVQSVQGDEDANSKSGYVFRGVGKKRMTAEQFVDAVWNLTGSMPSDLDATLSLNGESKLAGSWVWKDGDANLAPAGETVYFRSELELESIPVAASSIVTCDNQFELFINGQSVSRGNDYSKAFVSNIEGALRPGKNVILIKATNLGESPNPAALFAELLIRRDDAAEIERIGTDENWNWTTSPVDELGMAKEATGFEWKSAVVLDAANEIYQKTRSELESADRKLADIQQFPVRAALVQSDLLMRSLGRPNREQVVTTRPESLSTLQALDLSNGEILAEWLKAGGKMWLDKRHENQWSDQELVSKLFRQAIARDPSPSELEMLTPLDAENVNDAVEDLLWVVVMLPEFQLIR